MKLRLRGSTVRLRLTRSEVSRFAETGLVEETVPFASSLFRYELRRSSSFNADFSSGLLSVTVPKELAHQWTATLQVGIEAQINGLSILIEKDFQCAHGQADGDAFQNEQLS